MKLTSRQATVDDVALVRSILQEAADWLAQIGQPLWREGELSEETVLADLREGHFHLFALDGEVAGTMKFQLSDERFWPDVPATESAFIHRFAVRRAFAGERLSSAMMSWAAGRAGLLGKRYLRLDCEASRSKLRAIYERFGFVHRDDRQVGAYFVSRYELYVMRSGE